MLDVRLLRYFATTADLGSIGAAARLLGVSQPTLSQQIRRLEASVHLTLFERSQAGVTLTREGAGLLVAVREVLEAHHRLDATLADLRPERPDIVTLGLIENIPADALTGFFEAVQRRLPGTRIDTVGQSTPNNLTAVRTAQLDAAIVRGPLAVDSAIRRTLLIAHPIGVLLRVDHRLAMDDQVPPSALVDEQLIYFPRSWAPQAFDHHRTQLLRHGIDLHLSTASHSTSQTIGFVTAGLGIALVSQHWAPDAPEITWRSLEAAIVTDYLLVTRNAIRLPPVPTALHLAADETRGRLGTVAN